MRVIHLALFTLKDYYRRTWLVAEIILIAILCIFYYDHFWLLRKAEVYPALGIFSLLLVSTNTMRMTSLETNSRMYIPLTKGLSRGEYLMGKALAVFLMDTLILVLMYMSAFLLTSVRQQFSFTAGLVHLIPLLLVLLIAEGIMLCASPLVSYKMGFFWGALLLVFGAAQPWKFFSYILPPIKPLISGSYENFTVANLWQYGLGVVYLIVFYKLAVYLFRRRELDFEAK